MAFPHLPWVRDREEISLPRSVINQIINEVVPDVEVSKESRELIFSCCTEFMFLLSAEANEVSNSQQKKTIDAEHVLHALDRLGFADFRIDAEEVVTQCKVIAARRRMKNIRFKNIGIPEEELLRVQQELFAKARQEQAAAERQALQQQRQESRNSTNQNSQVQHMEG